MQRALAECAALGCAFTAAMYVWPAERRHGYVRDDPKNIRRRIFSMLAVCLGGLLFVARRTKLRGTGALPFTAAVATTFREAVLGPSNVNSTFAAVSKQVAEAAAATLTLFAGVWATHLVEGWNALDESENETYLRRWGKGMQTEVATQRERAAKGTVSRSLQLLARGASTFGEEMAAWTGVRNYVVAPMMEELYFRGFVFALLSPPALVPRSAAAVPNQLKIAVSTAVFSLAHLHHLRRYYLDLRRRTTAQFSASEALILAFRKSLGDLLVTSAFGVVGGSLFVTFRENALATAVSHAICNYLGAPSLSYLFDRSLSPWQRRWITVAYVTGFCAFWARWMR